MDVFYIEKIPLNGNDRPTMNARCWHLTGSANGSICIISNRHFDMDANVNPEMVVTCWKTVFM